MTHSGGRAVEGTAVDGGAVEGAVVIFLEGNGHRTANITTNLLNTHSEIFTLALLIRDVIGCENFTTTQAIFRNHRLPISAGD